MKKYFATILAFVMCLLIVPTAKADEEINSSSTLDAKITELEAAGGTITLTGDITDISAPIEIAVEDPYRFEHSQNIIKYSDETIQYQ